MALSKFKKGDSDLTEPEWVLATDYKATLKAGPRSLRKSNVLKDVVLSFSGEEFDHYYYLIITTDEANPLDTVDKTFLPQLFKPHLAGNNLTFPNCWMEFRKQFGWLNYDKMKQFIHRIQDHLPADSLFLPTYEINEGGFGVPPDADENNDDDNDGGGNGGIRLKPPLTGRWIVKFKDKKCHLSCQKFSYGLRHLENRGWIKLDQGVKDEKKMRTMLSQVEVLQKAPRMNHNEILFWEKFFDDLGDCS